MSKIIDMIYEKRGVTEESLIPVRAELDWKEMEEAAKQFLPYLADDASELTFGVLYDPDVDGVFSGYIAEDFFKQLNIKVKNFMNHNKVHGLQIEALDWVKREGIDVLFVVDAGSGDEENLNLLASMGKKVFVLDHHPYETNYLDPRVTRVNVADHEDYPAISGCGVVYHFLEQLEKQYHFGINTKKYEKFVGITILSDICDMSVAENRYYVKQAYEGYNSEAFFRKFPFYGSYQSFYSYKMIPYINGLIRCNHIDRVLKLASNLDKERVIRDIPYDLEKVRTEQRNNVAKVLDSGKLYLRKGVTIHIRNPDGNESFNGLVANNLLGEHKRGALVLIYNKLTNMFKGSFRGFDFTNEVLTEWGFECHGHDKACGVSISKEGLNKFIKEFNHTPIETTNFDFKVKSDELTDKDWTDIAWFNEYAGANLPKVSILLEDAPIDHTDFPKKKVWIYDKLTVTDFGTVGDVIIVEPVIDTKGFQLLRR